MTDQPQDQDVDETVDDHDQDSEPTMTAPDDRRPDGTVVDLHGDSGDDAGDGSGSRGS
jgi:hypothetical protein